MNDQELLHAAIERLETLRNHFQKRKIASLDEMTFQDYLDRTLKQTKEAKRVANTLLIAREKFYQSSSITDWFE